MPLPAPYSPAIRLSAPVGVLVCLKPVRRSTALTEPCRAISGEGTPRPTLLRHEGDLALHGGLVRSGCCRSRTRSRCLAFRKRPSHPLGTLATHLRALTRTQARSGCRVRLVGMAHRRTQRTVSTTSSSEPNWRRPHVCLANQSRRRASRGRLQCH